MGTSNRGRRYTRTLVGYLTTLLCVGIALVVPASMSLASSTSTGPPGSANLRSVALVVSLSARDFPKGWRSNGDAGLCIASGPGSKPGTPYCGNAPLPGMDQQSNDDTFAQCIGLPVSRVSMFTGNDEPGEPFTYSSSMFSPPGNTSGGSPDDEGVSAQSILTVEKSSRSSTSICSLFHDRPSLNV